ncbi:RHS repeat domain-containing protein [Pseudoalteromonas ruthenica]|uniref:RHS repeat-associated core domain-containing protein n=1 Tax=Pseudoalteromonas ruthenica TaxID=151081 RepID=A0A0F4PXT4_9GAMM|nr:RHS repeat-associated core domain-containing protein [Pseudoalteromonas ruthenica]KJY95832.1 hypothetical protein TW76_14860 [Pseudoalteromonas ruthenica]KJZ00281.1 hypothetical protein TW72_06090 [Pseudoalteromonas ruthenica]
MLKLQNGCYHGAVGEQHTFTETYTYDDLHRLKTNQVNGIKIGSYTYDAIGNLLSKSDYSNEYDYASEGSGGPNAVKRVQRNGKWVSFSYDKRGNMLTGDGLSSATYNAMDKPTTLVKNGITSQFVYGPNHMRFKHTTNGRTTYYADKLYEEEVQAEETTWRAYIDNVAIVSQTNEQAVQIRYTHTDRLGSSRLFTNHNGDVLATRNYDPFGKPRLANGNSKPSARLGDIVDTTTYRGFTDHEHLDEQQLIHMNGRVYDYNLGRFLSVDPIVHEGSQGINPYSYIMNNPLSGTDPSGYKPEIETKDITKKVAVTGSRIKRNVVVGQNVTITNRDSGGAISSVTSFDAMNDGSISGAHITASNGKVDTVTVFGKDGNGEFSHTTDINSQSKLANESGGIGNNYQDPRPAPNGILENLQRIGEDIDYQMFKVGDMIGNATFATGVPDSIHDMADVGRRAANMIRTGHAGIGKELLYEESWFLYKFAPKGFSLNVDGRVIGNWGSIASPFPLDSTKVHGHISFDKNGRLKSGWYDFQQILQPHKTWDAKTYSRNRLNRIAIEQHGVGNRFMINYKYNDSDFQ